MKRITLFLMVIFCGFLAFSQGPGDLTEDQKIMLENERPNVENSVRLNPAQKASLVSPVMQIPISVNKSGALKARDGKNISVLVASPNAADFNTHVLPTMQTFGGITYTATSALGALTVEEMLGYDVVWTFNVSTWQTETGTTAVEWSNKLGDFITQGGYLVESQFVNSYDEWGLGSGLYITGNMSPFIKSTLDRPTATFNLGEVLIPSHPIMSGVSQVSTTYFVQNVQARADATLIAKWGNAEADPLVAVYDNIVAFNADPVMTTGSVMQPGIGGDGFLMFHNAIVWLYNNQADPMAPAAPTGLTATAGAMGALTVELEWTNPTTTFDGSPLTEITAIKIHREGVLIHTISSPAPGAALAYTDNTMTADGVYNYTVTAENALGDGPAAGVSVYVGEDLPAAPGDVTLVAQGNNGHVTWTAPVAGLNGGYLNPAGLNYKVVRMPGDVEVATGITATEYLDNTVPGIGNYYYAVTASNDLGEGGSANSNIALLGGEGVLMYETFDYAAGALPPGWVVDGMG
ncbi:MAG: fibronectin type III domain-containing protein, partial [Bacteroidales bacterium]|nr:fibronectin type III domain-containing protein [Bacteroidales bacterium]